MKTLGNTDQSKCRENVPDVVMFGGDLFKLMSKASSQDEGWMKSTKAMETPHGCMLQVTTQQRNPDGSYAVAEALCFVPGVSLIELQEGDDDTVTSRGFSAPSLFEREMKLKQMQDMGLI